MLVVAEAECSLVLDAWGEEHPSVIESENAITTMATLGAVISLIQSNLFPTVTHSHDGQLHRVDKMVTDSSGHDAD